jgi:hypothetical protein
MMGRELERRAERAEVEILKTALADADALIRDLHAQLDSANAAAVRMARRLSSQATRRAA